MDSNSIKYLELLIKQIRDLHELTLTTCNMCGGHYIENLNGATSYFTVDDKPFKIIIEKL